MRYVTMWKVAPEHIKTAIARFKETGGAPPDGVKMLGRWHDVAGSRGVVLAESDNAEAMYRWTHAWSDIMQFETFVVVDDEQAAKVLFS